MSETSTSELQVEPVGAELGAEIRDMDLRQPLTPARRDEVRALLGHHQVLFWRDQQLTTEQQVAFVRSFGPVLDFTSVVDDHPELPGVHKVTGSTVGWHIDASAQLRPPVATVLRAVTVPAAGGDTIWASGVGAYAALPDEVKQRLEGLYATHGSLRHFTPGYEEPLVSHPLVRVHPETGEKALYLNLAEWQRTVVVGLSRQESDELVALLREEYLRPEHQVRFHWTPGAVAMWDNRVVQHTGVHDYGDAPRELTRICLARFEPAAAA